MLRSLHARIVLGYGYLAALALLGAVGAAYGFLRLAGAAEEHAAGEGASLEALAETTRQLATLYGLLAVLALVSFALLSRALRSRLLDRLEELAAVARAVAEGETARRVRVDSGDELGTVARQLNAVLDARQSIENRARGRLASLRQVTLGLLAARSVPAAVLGLGGELLASTLDPDLSDHLSSPDEEAAESLQAALDGETEVRRAEIGPWVVQLEPLETPTGRPVGFLVEVVSVAAEGSPDRES